MPDVRLLPAREFPLDDAGRTRFRSRFREVFEGDPSKSPLYKDISNGVVPGGIEYYLPLFFDATATLADYLPRDATVVACTATSPSAIERFWQDTESRYQLLRGDKARPLLPPTELFLPLDAFNGALKAFARIEFRRSLNDGRCGPRRRPVRTPQRVRPSRCRRSRSTAAPTIRSPRSSASSRRATRPRADLRRERRPARDDAAVLRRVRPQRAARR